VEELRKYDEALYEKPRWLVLNKIDMLSDSEQVVNQFVKDYEWKGRVFAISAISGLGCKELTYAIMQHIDENKQLMEDFLKDSGLINESANDKPLKNSSVELQESATKDDEN
jgi:GTP-binding protein